MKLRGKRSALNIKQEVLEVDSALDTARSPSKYHSSRSSGRLLKEENLNSNKFTRKRENNQTQMISTCEITSQSNTNASENIECMGTGVKQEGTAKAEALLNTASGNYIYMCIYIYYLGKNA